MNPQIFHFKHQCVRDLAWVVASPPLIKNSEDFNNTRFLDKQFFNAEYKNIVPLLDELDSNPEQLISHIEERNTRLLGKYFECLVEFWLMNSRGKELLAANIQIEEKKNTIGEIDFIYRDKNSGDVIHLEAAGKFYMAHENKTEWNNFIGPNANDNLGRKLEKLITNQIKLTEEASAKKYLNSIGIAKSVKPVVLCKGYIFYHADRLLVGNYLLPKHAEPSHRKGWWIRRSEIEKYFTGEKTWLILERYKWISPVYGDEYGELFSSLQLIDKLDSYFSNNTYPLIIVEIDEKRGILVEKTRGFVVSDKWPSK